MKYCQEFKPAKILLNKIYAGKPISISLSPNTEKDDIDLALKLIFQPRKWKIGVNQSNQYKSASQELEEEFKKYLGVKPAFAKASAGKYAISFNSGRAGLMAILDALEVKEKDEVLLQAFTCNSAVNPILYFGAKPVFVDIDETINLDPEDLKKKITKKSKAVMIQHTFGRPAKINEVSKICQKYNLFLIEDCAHSLGAKYKGENCGTFGDAAFFSFGRDKIISSVFGGMVVTNNEKIGERIKEFQEKLDFPSNFWIFQQLLHPILTNYIVLPAYSVNSALGRTILGLLHILKVLSKGVYKKEKKGEIPEYFPKKLPNALAILALNQFKKLERFNRHRKEIAKIYNRECREAEMENYHVSLKNILSLTDVKTKLIFIANPNNPTGTFFTKTELLSFLKEIPPTTYVVLDDAYNEYVTAQNFPDVLSIYKQYKNIIILHSFSKIYGLAGLRIGYGIMQKPIIDDFEANRVPFSVNSIANIAVLAALDDIEYLQKCASENAKEREFLINKLRMLEYNVIESQSNFIFLYFSTTEKRDNVYDVLFKNKIVVRKMDTFGDNKALRISIGKPEENKKIVECLTKYNK